MLLKTFSVNNFLFIPYPYSIRNPVLEVLQWGLENHILGNSGLF